MMTIHTLPPFPAHSNPFHHDITRMGTPLGDNVMVMHSNHSHEHANHLIVIDIRTGQRLLIEFEEKGN